MPRSPNFLIFEVVVFTDVIQIKEPNDVVGIISYESPRNTGGGNRWGSSLVRGCRTLEVKRAKSGLWADS
jgi:hypothetical protein